MPRRAFSLIELLVIIAILIVGLALLLPAIGRPRCGTYRPLKDSNQVRGTVQAMVVWASNNRGSYPIPSELDTENTTLEDPGAAKDTTANILSLLIFNGNISPEICVSPAESNPQVQRFDNYQYEHPSIARIPARALWDPAFRGTPEDAVTYSSMGQWGAAHNSYAHALPFGKRRAQWKDTYNSTEAVFGNRGPTYAPGGGDAAPASATWKLLPGPLGTQSNTLLIHGGRSTWEGNIGYNDNHVNFETKPTPDALTLLLPGRGQNTNAPDNLFVNETDQLHGDGTTGRIDQGANAYLRPISKVTDPARPKVWRD